MAGMSAEKAFRKFQPDLLDLPMNVAKFVSKLESENFFAGNQKASMIAEKTEPDKALYFLDDVVKRNIDMYFERLLKVMNEYDKEIGGPMSKLALKIWAAMGKSGEPGESSSNPPTPEPEREPRKRKISKSDSPNEDPDTRKKFLKKRKRSGAAGSNFDAPSTSKSVLLTDKILSSKPEFPALLKELESVAEWETVGAYLLNDKDGSKIEQIESSCNGDVKKCRSRMIREYLKSGDVSWQNVLTSLREAGYKNLADRLEKSLLSKR